MILFSAIVPIYKVPEKMLRKCIKSLINQKYAKLEIILVDDGSPDNCGKICEEFAKKDNRIKVFHQKNKGLSGARNLGVKVSKGDYIVFVDGDDFIENDMFEVLGNVLNNNSNIDILICDFNRCIENKKYVQNCEGISSKINYDTEDLIYYLRKMILNFNSKISSACGKAIKKEVLMENKIQHNENLKQGAEGIEFCFRLFKYCKFIKYINIPLYNYVYNNESISSFPSNENNHLILKCFEEINNNIDKSDKEMKEFLYWRLNYFIVTTAVSSYFNPKNKDLYKIKKKQLKLILDNALIRETFLSKTYRNIDSKRKVIIILLKYRMYFLVYILSFFK